MAGCCPDAILYEKKYRKIKQKAKSLRKEREVEKSHADQYSIYNAELITRNNTLETHMKHAATSLEAL